MTDDNNDMIYELTVPLEAGDIQYKFTADGWTDQEDLTGLTACTFTDGTFTNRAHSITGDAVLDVVCWGSCEACALSVDELGTVALNLFPNPANDLLNIEMDQVVMDEIRVLDVMGRVLEVVNPNASSVKISTAQWPVGLYQIAVHTPKGWNTERFAVSRQLICTFVWEGAP